MNEGSGSKSLDGLSQCPLAADVQHVAAAAFVMDALHGRENTVYNINPVALKCEYLSRLPLPLRFALISSFIFLPLTISQI